ncbi:hypothetical protein RB595_006316 [Gaeumannomyces hyphopodioides]
MAGFLIPPWYQVTRASPEMLGIAVFLMGCFAAITIFTTFKAAGQTYKVLKRKRGRRPSTYIIMVWLDWLVNILMAVLAWLFINDDIEPSFWLFISLICLFVLEWGTASALMVICASVFVVWIPAHLQISPKFILINNVWDRIEKFLILVLDAGLNGYFLWLVKSTLIDYGLTKYKTLFRFNLLAVFVSVSLDAINIGVMSIQDGWMYMIFQPMAYMIKLYIELNMADLICSIALDPSKRSRLSPSIRDPTNQEPPSDCFPDWWDDRPSSPSAQLSLTTPGRRAAAINTPLVAAPLELQGLVVPSASHPASPIAGDEQNLISPVRSQPREKPRERPRGEDR